MRGGPRDPMARGWAIFRCCRGSARHILQRCPPPVGYEEFFAALERDPMASCRKPLCCLSQVVAPSSEKEWMKIRGARRLRA